MYGSHAAVAYSSIGLTREVYTSDLTSGGGAAIDVTTNEIQIPSIALDETAETCLSQQRSEEIVMARQAYESTEDNWSVPR